MNDINFWNDKEKADEVIKEASNIKSTIEKITIIKNNLDTNIETLEILKDEEEIEDEKEEQENEKNIFEDEIKLPLDEEFDEAVVIDKMDGDRAMSFYEVKENVKKQTDTYLTYKVYIFKEEDTIENILEKYNITKEQLSDYNNLEEIVAGSKLVIPSFND